MKHKNKKSVKTEKAAQVLTSDARTNKQLKNKANVELKEKELWFRKSYKWKLMTWKSPEALQDRIELYFETQVGREAVRNLITGRYIKNFGQLEFVNRPPTVSGLALFCGFAGRQAMYDVVKSQPELQPVIAAAIDRVGRVVEELLVDGKRSDGAKFWLKNHGWKDESTLLGPGGGPVMPGKVVFEGVPAEKPE